MGWLGSLIILGIFMILDQIFITPYYTYWVEVPNVLVFVLLIVILVSSSSIISLISIYFNNHINKKELIKNE